MLNADDAAGLDAFLSRQTDGIAAPLLASGVVIEDWRVTGLLGRGGNGEVYRVVRGGETAALKIRTKDGDSARVRFAEEVRFLCENALPQFPRFISAGEFEGREFVVMELLDPIDLPRDEAGIADYLLALCGCVRALHLAGVVHRDIKPKNVLRRPDGGIVLIDFGLATDLSGSVLPRDEISVVEGRAVGVGTSGYAAPEQLTGGRVSSAADIHALGCIANVAFGGNPPRNWAEIIRRSTSSIPEQRFGSVDEFAAAIRRRNRARHLVVFGLMAALSVAAVALVMLYRKQGAAESLPLEAASLPHETESLPLVAESPSFAALCENIVTNVPGRGPAEVTIVNLSKGYHPFKDEIKLSAGREYWLVGDHGVLNAPLVSENGDRVTLRIRGCTVINRSSVPIEKAGLWYCLEGYASVHFVNQSEPKSSDWQQSAFAPFEEGSNGILFDDPDDWPLP